MRDVTRQGELVVAHFRDGGMLKGYTYDFVPARGTFHITSERSSDKGRIHEVNCADLKALFFVKTLEGKKEYVEKKRFNEIDSYGLLGLKIRVEFSDGEIIRGMSFDFSENFRGFYIMPVDPQGNNRKIYVIAEDLNDVKIGEEAEK